jgi:hypothetical protein
MEMMKDQPNGNYYIWSAKDYSMPGEKFVWDYYRLDRRTLELKGWIPGKSAAFSALWQCKKIQKQL